MGQLNLWAYTGTAGAPTRQVKLPWDKWGIGGLQSAKWVSGITTGGVSALTRTVGGPQRHLGVCSIRWGSTGRDGSQQANWSLQGLYEIHPDRWDFTQIGWAPQINLGMDSGISSGTLEAQARQGRSL